METPVIYFYASRDTTVDVQVRFRQGLITEHYPRATVLPALFSTASLTQPGLASTIAWRNVRVLPGAVPLFQTQSEPNHYYAARETEAAPLEIGEDRERFLFYRGVGNLGLPVAATVGPGDEIAVECLGEEEIPALMLFENRGVALAIGFMESWLERSVWRLRTLMAISTLRGRRWSRCWSRRAFTRRKPTR